MECPEAQQQIGSWLDDELPTEIRQLLDAHLADCPDCQAVAESMRLADAELRTAFTPLRQTAGELATRVNRQLPIPRKSATPSWTNKTISLLIAAAAGFLLAVVLFRPWETKEPVAARPAMPIARLALATGPVEVQPPQAASWSTWDGEMPLEPGTSLATGPNSQCEVATKDGSAIRLNRATQVALATERSLTISEGQLRSYVCPSNKPQEVDAPDARIVTEQGTFDLVCQPQRTVVTVVEGQVQVQPGKQGQMHRLAAGERMTLVGGVVAEESSSPDPTLESGWINDLLVLKGPDDPELAERINGLCAQIGQAKLSHLYEDEIRRLGDSCVVPLVRFVESAESATQPQQRVTAARIVADVAQPRSIDELIRLLSDADPQVRFHAAAGLQRLTGRDQGLSPQQWRAEWTSCQPTHQKWQQWWEQHKKRYPAVPNLPPVGTKASQRPIPKSKS